MLMDGFGHHFLAAACLTDNQNRGVLLGHPFHHGHELAHDFAANHRSGPVHELHLGGRFHGLKAKAQLSRKKRTNPRTFLTCYGSEWKVTSVWRNQIRTLARRRDNPDCMRILMCRIELLSVTTWW